ncbi:MAG: hypothetical protein K2J08_09905 [Ruminococcus sp.]|nr:hypothetical protein [Ruminococcus sp.]
MDALDLVTELVLKAFDFLRGTVIFGKSVFFWCLGFSAVNIVISYFIGGDDDSD